MSSGVWSQIYAENTLAPPEVDSSPHLDAGVGPVVVRALVSWDAASRPPFTFVPEAHTSLSGLLKKLRAWLNHCVCR